MQVNRSIVPCFWEERKKKEERKHPPPPCLTPFSLRENAQPSRLSPRQFRNSAGGIVQWALGKGARLADLQGGKLAAFLGA